MRSYAAIMSDYLKRRIEETRLRLDASQRDVAVLQGELRAYEDALAHAAGEADQPGKVEPALPRLVPAVKTGHWGAIIQTLASRGDRFTIDDVVRELGLLGLKPLRKSVRGRLVDLVKDGTLVRLSDGVFAVPTTGQMLRAIGAMPPHARLVGEA